jgi:hypothetical protein
VDDAACTAYIPSFIILFYPIRSMRKFDRCWGWNASLSPSCNRYLFCTRNSSDVRDGGQIDANEKPPDLIFTHGRRYGWVTAVDSHRAELAKIQRSRKEGKERRIIFLSDGNRPQCRSHPRFQPELLLLRILIL